MMHVKIVRRPDGPAPDWVRDAWIGLILPTLSASPRKVRVFGSTMPTSVWHMLRDLLRGHTDRQSGYLVPARAALDILAETQPEAAEWWRTNAATTLRMRGNLLFYAAACEHLGGTPGGKSEMLAGYKRLFPALPGRIAILWAAAILVRIAEIVCFGGDDHSVMSSIFLSGIPIFAGLLAAWLMRLRGTTLHLLCALISLDLAIHLLVFLLSLGLPSRYDKTILASRPILQIVGIAGLIGRGFYWICAPWRRVAASAVAAFVTIGAGNLPNLDYEFYRLSNVVRPLIGRPDPEPADKRDPDIEEDRLWDAQRGLVAAQIAALNQRDAGTANVYAMAVAGSGTQDLFGREAQAALKTAAIHFGASDRGGTLLSNALADQLHAPFATRSNIVAVAKGIGTKADHTHDLLFAYLVSHGSRTAELASDLPNYQAVQPISATSLAQALNEGGIHHRVIVISACFAASWAPPLANDDTIVIAAAAKDRTSFGCDDSRKLTYFGEAFLASLASPTISLHDAFEQAKRKITAQETAQNVTPSLPQAFVGRNMTALWLGDGDRHKKAQ